MSAPSGIDNQLFSGAPGEPPKDGHAAPPASTSRSNLRRHRKGRTPAELSSTFLAMLQDEGNIDERKTVAAESRRDLARHFKRVAAELARAGRQKSGWQRSR